MKLEFGHSVNIVFTLTLLFTLYYLFCTPPIVQDLGISETSLENPVIIKKTAYTTCDRVDIKWLAGDRIYWNGWVAKTMFIKPDGTFTRSNVHIKEGDEVCIVVLLGPRPAYSPQLETNHFGPKDSISIFAQGNFTRKTIHLQQHSSQSNAYYAPVRFHHADIYELSAIEEYRSYFWEKPILHRYDPFHFLSENKLVVTQTIQQQIKSEEKLLPTCQLNDSRTGLEGTWVDPLVYGQAHRQALYMTYQHSEQDVAFNGKVFIPDTCQLEYQSEGSAMRCLGSKTVHVWGDNNLRRNLKAITFNGQSWCDVETISKIEDEAERKVASRCICNDDEEDRSLYPWIENPYTPIKINNAWDIDVSIYYQSVEGSLNQLSLNQRMYEFTKNETLVKKADVVVLGFGNDDIRGLQITPEYFQIGFNRMLQQVRQVYPDQPIIVRTPQYFCCGVIRNTSWNSARSFIFSAIVRDLVAQHQNVMLWDVYSLGTDETTCLSEGTTYTTRKLITVENQLLWSMMCSSQSQ